MPGGGGDLSPHGRRLPGCGAPGGGPHRRKDGAAGAVGGPGRRGRRPGGIGAAGRGVLVAGRGRRPPCAAGPPGPQGGFPGPAGSRPLRPGDRGRPADPGGGADGAAVPLRRNPLALARLRIAGLGSRRPAGGPVLRPVLPALPAAEAGNGGCAGGLPDAGDDAGAAVLPPAGGGGLRPAGGPGLPGSQRKHRIPAAGGPGGRPRAGHARGRGDSGEGPGLRGRHERPGGAGEVRPAGPAADAAGGGRGVDGEGPQAGRADGPEPAAAGRGCVCLRRGGRRLPAAEGPLQICRYAGRRHPRPAGGPAAADRRDGPPAEPPASRGRLRGAPAPDGAAALRLRQRLRAAVRRGGGRQRLSGLRLQPVAGPHRPGHLRRQGHLRRGRFPGAGGRRAARGPRPEPRPGGGGAGRGGLCGGRGAVRRLSLHPRRRPAPPPSLDAGGLAAAAGAAQPEKPPGAGGPVSYGGQPGPVPVGPGAAGPAAGGGVDRRGRGAGGGAGAGVAGAAAGPGQRGRPEVAQGCGTAGADAPVRLQRAGRRIAHPVAAGGLRPESSAVGDRRGRRGALRRHSPLARRRRGAAAGPRGAGRPLSRGAAGFGGADVDRPGLGGGHGGGARGGDGAVERRRTGIPRGAGPAHLALLRGQHAPGGQSAAPGQRAAGPAGGRGTAHVPHQYRPVPAQLPFGKAAGPCGRGGGAAAHGGCYGGAGAPGEVAGPAVQLVRHRHPGPAAAPLRLLGGQRQPGGGAAAVRQRAGDRGRTGPPDAGAGRGDGPGRAVRPGTGVVSRGLRCGGGPLQRSPLRPAGFRGADSQLHRDDVGPGARRPLAAAGPGLREGGGGRRAPVLERHDV